MISSLIFKTRNRNYPEWRSDPDNGRKAKMHKVVIIGPSQRFLSGISYVTLLLSNSLADYFSVTALLFRNMLPKKLFPGYRRVGETLANCDYRSDITVVELLDWYNPLTWMQASKYIRQDDVIIFQWWTSSVAHMYLANCTHES